eukprot:1929647-Rhodomonas_salina.2
MYVPVNPSLHSRSSSFPFSSCRQQNHSASFTTSTNSTHPKGASASVVVESPDAAFVPQARALRAFGVAGCRAQDSIRPLNTPSACYPL